MGDGEMGSNYVQSEKVRSYIQGVVYLFIILYLDVRDSNPPKQSEGFYQSPPLPPSHHGWVECFIFF